MVQVSEVEEPASAGTSGAEEELLATKTVDDALESARVAGNEMFSAKRYREAIDLYTKAIETLPGDFVLPDSQEPAAAASTREDGGSVDDDEPQRGCQCSYAGQPLACSAARCFSNRAACHAALGDWPRSAADARHAVFCDATCVAAEQPPPFARGGGADTSNFPRLQGKVAARTRSGQCQCLSGRGRVAAVPSLTGTDERTPPHALSMLE